MSAAENAWQQRGACNGAATATDSMCPEHQYSEPQDQR